MIPQKAFFRDVSAEQMGKRNPEHSTENFDVDEMANLAMAILLIRHQNHQLFKETLLPLTTPTRTAESQVW